MSAIRDEVTSLLDRLPDDASIEDLQYHLYVVEKVRNGLEAARSEGSVPQEQAEEKLGKWLIPLFGRLVQLTMLMALQLTFR